MHRSRLTALAIDVPEGVHRQEADFWSGALGTGQREDVDGDPYVDLDRRIGGLEVFVQRIGDDAARYHLDIETDDVDAEVARLEALGGSRLEQVRGWWVMRDPAGLLFCVVPPQTHDFPGDAATWA
jgi:glyoxalase superfamily protein